jgi:hypothetical protein
MGWKSYGLDQVAQKLVLDAKQRDQDSLNQSYKMRMATAYGLERFWGEHLRLQRKEPEKAQYWKDTWNALVKVMEQAGVTIPNDQVNANDVETVRSMSEKLWELDIQSQRLSLAVLTQLCDCIVWWTQRHKG